MATVPFFRVGPPANPVLEISDRIQTTLDSSIFFPAYEVQPAGGTYTLTRLAAGDIVWRKTAAANTSHIHISLRRALRNGVLRYFRLSSFDYIYGIGTDVLTSHAVRVDRVTYANNTAVAIVSAGGTLTGTLATATQANLYVTRVTFGTPITLVAPLEDVRIELEIVATAAAVFDFYGVAVNLL